MLDERSGRCSENVSIQATIIFILTPVGTSALHLIRLIIQTVNRAERRLGQCLFSLIWCARYRGSCQAPEPLG
jgi:hypothetical protein